MYVWLAPEFISPFLLLVETTLNCKYINNAITHYSTNEFYFTEAFSF